MAGLADTRGHLTKTYQYTVTGELAYGSAAYENEYTYNGESYNPNIHSQYLRARYYSVVTASFLTEDSYLGNIREPLTLNRYNYCVSNYLNYVDPSGNSFSYATIEPAGGLVEVYPIIPPEVIDQYTIKEDTYKMAHGGIDLILNPGWNEKEAIKLHEAYARVKQKIETCDRREITFNNDLYYNWGKDHYRIVADLIAQITNQDIIYTDDLLIQIANVYERQKQRYEDLSKKSQYIPPELIAAIHYRENATDYLNETFSVYLHNGDLLGIKSHKVPHPDMFGLDEFDEAALDALKGNDGYSDYKENLAKDLGLTPDSTDLTAMVTYSIVYNGWVKNTISSYAFSKTDIYVGGQYISDGNYDSKSIDDNFGTYLVLLRLLTPQ